MDSIDSRGLVAGNKSEIVAALPLACHDEAAAVAFLERARWADCPCCVHCGSVAVYAMTDRATGQRNRRWLWRCKDCKRQYTYKVGSVMEDSPIPARHWCFVFWSMCAGKKSISAMQIQRETGLSYKSALFMVHRVRWAMTRKPDAPKLLLRGVVECDETWVGGRVRHPQNQPIPTRVGRRVNENKPAVAAMVERGGRVVAMPLDRVTGASLSRTLLENIDRSAQVITDDYPGYKRVGRLFPGGHRSVIHSKREYARREPDGTVTHTNTVEGFFSLLKRQIYGTHHSVSKRHLHRYVSEAAFKYNTRKVDDGERTLAAIRGASGKRLVYKQPA